MLLAPTICLFIFGMTVIDSKQRELKEVQSPKPFFCLGEKCESSSDRGGEGSVFPKCLIFDRDGGKYGYGKLIPGAKCTSVMYAPSGNSEVKELFSTLSKKVALLRWHRRVNGQRSYKKRCFWDGNNGRSGAMDAKRS